MRQRDELLAVPARLAEGRGMGGHPQGAVGQVAGQQQDRLRSRGDRHLIGEGYLWGGQNEAEPDGPQQKGTKHHRITDAQGISLEVHVTEANRHNVTEMLPLVGAIPAIGSKRGRPWKRPDVLQGDTAYYSYAHHRELRQRLIKPLFRQRGINRCSGLGKTRWVVERTLSWLH
jgi:transposase